LDPLVLAIWRDEYEIGVPVIDAQHQGLFQLVNELHEAMMLGQGKDLMGTVLDRLIQYARTHFRDEEEVMAKAGYPDLEAHRNEHEAFSRQVFDLQRDFRAGNVTISLKVVGFLVDWLENHIKQRDQEFAPYLRRSGQPPRDSLGESIHSSVP
jgi:hemerythrin